VNGRDETLRYHQEFYSRHDLDEDGTWLGKPSKFVMRSLRHLPDGPVTVYDLGAGVGRHALPIAEAVADGSTVIGVDFLPMANEKLLENAAEAGVEVEAVTADLEEFDLPAEAADLIFGISALEHVSSLQAFEDLLHRLKVGTKHGGLHCLEIFYDRYEVEMTGVVRPALVEFPLSQDDLVAVIDRVYGDWERLEEKYGEGAVEEARNGEPYKLKSSNLRLLVKKP
jgi:tellurite methyltransferase